MNKEELLQLIEKFEKRHGEWADQMHEEGHLKEYFYQKGHKDMAKEIKQWVEEKI